MVNKLNNPRGTADILPEQIKAWKALEETSRRMFQAYAYREVRTPIFEEAALFKRSLGETTEVVNKQLLTLTGQKESGQSSVVSSQNKTVHCPLATDPSSDLALRPEGTAPIVRMYNQNGLERHEGLSKFFYIGPMFRGERPQKGRLRQFHQIGAEAIGRFANNPLLDAEMIALSVGLLRAFGVDGFKLKINSLGSLEDKAQFSAWLREALKDKIGSLSDDCKSQFERNVFRLLDSKDKDCQGLIRSLEIGTKHLSAAGLAYFEQVKAALDRLGVAYEVSPNLVRGLDYYTHTVFEISYEGLGAQDAIGAGGRYNGLIEQLNGNSREQGAGCRGKNEPDATALTPCSALHAPSHIGAIGFALGMERILLALEAQGKTVEAAPGVDVFVASASEELEAEVFGVVNALRQAGVSAEMDFGKRAFKKQMEQANKMAARFSVIIGSEVKNGQVVLKDMKSGEQSAVSLDQIADILQTRLV